MPETAQRWGQSASKRHQEACRGDSILACPSHCYSRFNRQTLCKWIWQKGRSASHLFQRCWRVFRCGLVWAVSCCRQGPTPPPCLPTEHLTGYPAVTPFHPHPPISSSSAHACPVLQSHRAVFTCALCGPPPLAAPCSTLAAPLLPHKELQKKDL